MLKIPFRVFSSINGNLKGWEKERALIDAVDRSLKRFEAKAPPSFDRKNARDVTGQTASLDHEAEAARHEQERASREAEAQRQQQEKEREATRIDFELRHGIHRPPAVDRKHAVEQTRPQVSQEQRREAKLDADQIQREIRNSRADAPFNEKQDAGTSRPTPANDRGREMGRTSRGRTAGVAGKALDGIANGIGRIISAFADSFLSILDPPTSTRQQPRGDVKQEPGRAPEPEAKPYQWEPPKPQPRRSKTDEMLDEIRRTKPARTPADELRDELDRERERRRYDNPGHR